MRRREEVEEEEVEVEGRCSGRSVLNFLRCGLEGSSATGDSVARRRCLEAGREEVVS